MANPDNIREKRSPMNSKLTRRQVIKAGGVAALGLVFSKPIVQTLRPKPVSANVSFNAGGGINPTSSPTPFALTLSANQGARIRRETPDPNSSPTPPFADQTLNPNILAVIRDFSDATDPIDRIGRAVLYFDVSPIPSGSTISSALLTMVCTSGLGSAPLISAHKVLVPSNPPTYSGPFPSWSRQRSGGTASFPLLGQVASRPVWTTTRP